MKFLKIALIGTTFVCMAVSIVKNVKEIIKIDRAMKQGNELLSELEKVMDEVKKEEEKGSLVNWKFTILFNLYANITCCFMEGEIIWTKRN